MPARLLCLCLWLLALAPLQAAPDKPSNPAVKDEIVAIVDSQLQAFRAGDMAKAYTFASIDIRNSFPLEKFEQMVRGSYTPIFKSKKSDFGICLDDGDQAVLNVTVEGADGTRTQYQYYLVKEEKGWRISGVKDMAAGASRA